MSNEHEALTPYDYACWKAHNAICIGEGYTHSTHWLCTSDGAKRRAEGFLLGTWGISNGVETAKREIIDWHERDTGYQPWRARELAADASRRQHDHLLKSAVVEP